MKYTVNMRFLTALLITLVTLTASAQKKFEGIIEYQMTYENLPSEMAGMESMFPQKQRIVMSKNFSRMDQELGMGGNMVVISDAKQSDYRMYMNAMGKKIKIALPEEEINKSKEKAGDVNIEYVDETMEVLGYECKKAIIKNGEDEITVFYTEKIPVPSIQEQFNQLKGFPLYYQMEKSGMTINVTATKVEEEKVDKSEFEDLEGYEEMSLEDYKALMGGGGQ